MDITQSDKIEDNAGGAGNTGNSSSKGGHPWGSLTIALGEAMALSAAAGLFIPALRGDDTATMLTVTAWFVLAWALQRGLRRLKTPGWASLAIALITSAIAALTGLGLILYHPSTLLDPAWLTSIGNDWASGGLASLSIILIGATALLAWGRGAWLGFVAPTFGAAATSFQLGLVVILSSFGLAALLERPLPFAVGLSLAFCFFSVLAMALEHHQQVVGRRDADAERSWLTIVLVGLVLALLVGVLVGIVVNGDLLRQVVALIGAALELVGRFFQFLAHLFPSDPSPQSALPPPQTAPMPAGQPEKPFQIFPEEWRLPGQYVVGAMFALLVALAVLRVVSDILRMLLRPLRAANASVEKVGGGWGYELRAFLGMLRGLLKVLVWQLHRLRPAETSTDSPLVGEVRDAYRGLLYWTAQRGLRRAEQETPHEYLRRVSGTLPAAEPDLRALTERYVLARYYPQQLSEDDCRAARESWQRLRKQLRWWMAPKDNGYTVISSRLSQME